MGKWYNQEYKALQGRYGTMQAVFLLLGVALALLVGLLVVVAVSGMLYP